MDLTVLDTFVEFKRRIGTAGGFNPAPSNVAQLDEYRVDSGRGQNRTLRGKAAVECAIGGPLTDSAVRASTTAWPNSTSSPPSSLLECRPSRRSGQTAKTRRPDGRARAPGPRLTPWEGPRPAHRRIPVAKAPIAPLAYDSALCLNRPEAWRKVKCCGVPTTWPTGWRAWPTPRRSRTSWTPGSSSRRWTR